MSPLIRRSQAHPSRTGPSGGPSGHAGKDLGRSEAEAGGREHQFPPIHIHDCASCLASVLVIGRMVRETAVPAAVSRLAAGTLNSGAGSYVITW